MTGKKFSQRGLMQGAAALGAAALIPEGLAQQVARSASAPGAPLPGRGELLIRGVTVLTMDPALPDLAAGDAHVREGAIIAVAPMVEAPAAQVIDGAGMICIPGFVDTHFHLWNAMKKIGVAIGLTLAFTASGQPEGTQVEYGPDDLATIVTTYKQDEARFSRDFAGKKFSGIMPFYSAQSSLVGGYYISLGSGIVLCEYVRSSDFNNANNWNRGDPIQVKGTIDDVTQGILTLKGCSFLKAVELK